MALGAIALGLTLSGCLAPGDDLGPRLSRFKTAGKAEPDKPRPPEEPPAGMHPVPSIHASINRGFESEAEAATEAGPGAAVASAEGAARGNQAVDPWQQAIPRPAPTVAASDASPTGPAPAADPQPPAPKDAEAVPASAAVEPRAPAPLEPSPTSSPQPESGPSDGPMANPPAESGSPAASKPPAGTEPEGPAAASAADPMAIVDPPTEETSKPEATAPPIAEPAPTEAVADPAPASDPAEAAPAPMPAPTGAPPEPMPAASPQAQADAPLDPAVRTASASADEAAEVKSEIRIDPFGKGTLLGRNVARVGDVTITLEELLRAMRDYLKKHDWDGSKLGPDETEMLAQNVLKNLIDRTLIIEEARTEMKKHWDEMTKKIDELWEKDELPQLLRRYKVDTRYELETKLEKENESLDHIREVYRLDSISYQYLMSKVGEKFRTSYPQMREYYEAHLKDFDRPEQVTWREVLIRVKDGGNRAEALRRAEAALDRLRRGEPFAKVARSVSQGPTADKGGEWTWTELGTHASEAVNHALKTLTPRQVSTILEAPDGYRIVRVEARRPAGPAPFGEAEVQDKIRRRLFEETSNREIDAYINKLKERSMAVVLIKFKTPLKK